MTEAEWLASETADLMLTFLGAAPGGGRALKRERRPRPNRRKLRLFACACLRPFQHLLSASGQRAIEVAEQFADGIATEEERASAEDNADRNPDLDSDGTSPGYWLASAAHAVVSSSARQAAYGTPSGISSAISTATAPAEWGGEVPSWVPPGGDEPVHRVQAHLLRDVFGNPFRPVTLRGSWLTRAVVSLAQAAHNERLMPSGQLDSARLTILADALEEAGCTERAILDHLRGPGPHVRGCFAVDLLLARE
jgi:hypothetical protein